MEVHVRNVPSQSTENSLRKFLIPHFRKLSILYVHCQKDKGKTFANLTFLYAKDAVNFLSHHGQSSRNFQGKTPQIFQKSSAHSTLKFLGVPIYCEKSYRDANPFLLRVLVKKEKDSKNKTDNLVPSDTYEASILPIIFECTTLECGAWSFHDSQAIFEPQMEWDFTGIVKFGEHSMIAISDSGVRVDFHYSGTHCITTEEGSTSSFIFSMCEPPKFYQKIQANVLGELMAQLGFQNRTTQVRKNGPDRHRLSSLGGEHQLLAGSCLVYRITLEREIKTDTDNSVGVRMHLLSSEIESLPKLLQRHVDVHRPQYLHSVGLKELFEKLASNPSELPFVVKFQLQKLAQSGYLPPATVLQLLPEVTNMVQRTPVPTCVKALRRLFNLIDFAGPHAEASEFELQSIIGLLLDSETKSKYEEESMTNGFTRSSRNVATIHRAKVTPTRVSLQGPEEETNNRVLRKYPNHHDYFLRVEFCEEDGQPLRFNPRVSNERIFHERFKGVLESGIQIAGRTYAFLGFSHSSLRAQSCWFMAPFILNGSLMWDRMIIQELGDFTNIRSPAKCAARIGQAFSDTRTALAIDPEIVVIVPDVEANGRVFSDGVGTMSRSVMHKLWERLPRSLLIKPTLYQIRYQGAKGVISLDSRLQGDVLVLRPSMIKFNGSTWPDVEICEAGYKPLPMYLNRQFIKILEDMGVEDKFFLDLQAKEVQRLRDITQSPANAATFLKQQSIGTAIHLSWFIGQLPMLNLDFRQDAFLRDTVEMAILMELRLLKHKTRIPVSKGWHLHGIMDETGLLEEGQIYCSVMVDGRKEIVVGKQLVITRAPALHPGDIQLATGVAAPTGHPLNQIFNCIVFSSKGTRDLPSQLSGGDLDGDRYYIMWDKNGRPKQRFSPADYPRLPPLDIGRTVERSDMIDHFLQFMETDQLGRIAVLHRVLADQKGLGTLDPDCILLSELHSTAVDFSKTGIPVDMTKLPKFTPSRPDFEAPGPHVIVEKHTGISFEEPDNRDIDTLGDEDDDFSSYRYYESEKILGKLYREIDERALFDQVKRRAKTTEKGDYHTVIESVWDYVQGACRGFEWKHHLHWARGIREMYEEKLLEIMTEFSEHPNRPLSELEAFLGNILGKTGSQSRRQRELSVSMKEKFEEDSAFIVNCILRDGAERSEESLERSLACFAASLEERIVFKKHSQLLSFKYIAAAICLREVERLPGV